MKINKHFLLFIISVFNIICLNGAAAAKNDLLKKPKQKESFGEAFTLSLTDSPIKLNFPSIYGTKIDFADSIPLFGKYFAADPGYLYNPNLVIIQNNTNSLLKDAFENLMNPLIYELYGIEIKNENERKQYSQKILKEKKINFYTLIVGNLFGKDFVPEDAINNLNSGIRNVAFHPVLSAWQPLITQATLQKLKDDPMIKKRDDLALIQNVANEIYIPIKMGIFESKGITNQAQMKEKFWNSAIAFNRFGYQAVNIHKDVQAVNIHKDDGQLRFSPDTAQFKIEKDRQLVIFWTMALSPDKSSINIAFVVLIDDEKLSTQIEQIASKAKNLDELIKGLQALKLSKNNQEVLKNAIDAIKFLATPKEETPIQPSVGPKLVASKEILNLFSNSAFNKAANLPKLKSSDIKKNIYQLTTEEFAKKDSLAQSIKYGVNIFHAMNLYGNNVNNFNAAIENATKSTQDAQCLIKNLGLENIKDREAGFVQEKINGIQAAAKSCKPYTNITPNDFTIINNITDVFVPTKPSIIKLLKDIKEFSNNKAHEYNHVILFEHEANSWITILITKKAGDVVKVIVLDPQNQDLSKAGDVGDLINNLLFNYDELIKKYDIYAKKIELPEINSIFGKGGYLELIKQHILKINNKEDAENAIKFLNHIEKSAQQDIKLLTPLRAFFASYDMYPKSQIYSKQNITQNFNLALNNYRNKIGKQWGLKA